MKRLTKAAFPLALIAPSVIVVATLVAYPVITIVINSFHENDLLSPPTFVGFDNYTYLLTADPFFWKVVGNTIVWTLATVTGEMLLGLLIALALNQAFGAKGFFRGLMTLPWIVPPVTAGLIWGALYNSQSGPFTQWLDALGLPRIGWLSDVNAALPSVIVVAIWKYTPLMAVGILAALQSIPPEHYEAAAVDGASRRQTLVHITLPAIAPVMTVLAILSVMWRFAQFDLIKILTGGGPAYASQLMAPFAYDKAIGRLEIGMASAVALIGVLIVLAAMGYFIRRIVSRDLA